MKIIREYSSDISVDTVLNEETNTKKWTVSGITLQSNIQNKNKRYYPKDVLEGAINKHVKDFLADGRALGELNHPDSNISSINLDRVSHKFVEVKEDGNNYITKAEVLDTPTGKIVQSLLAGNVKLGISSRGLGNVKAASGNNGSLVESLHLISLGDIVGDPSAPDAFLHGVLEGIEYEMKESGIIEKKAVEETIDIYSKLIQEASKEDLQKAVKSIFADFVRKINN
jgi:hypothetical protein